MSTAVSTAMSAVVSAVVSVGRDIRAVIASPLQRAQETAQPTASAYGLEIRTDAGLIEAENVFEDIAHPHRMNSRRGTQAVLIIQPFLIRQAQLRQAIAVKRFQSLGEGAH